MSDLSTPAKVLDYAARIVTPVGVWQIEGQEVRFDKGSQNPLMRGYRKDFGECNRAVNIFFYDHTLDAQAGVPKIMRDELHKRTAIFRDEKFLRMVEKEASEGRYFDARKVERSLRNMLVIYKTVFDRVIEPGMRTGELQRDHLMSIGYELDRTDEYGSYSEVVDSLRRKYETYQPKYAKRFDSAADHEFTKKCDIWYRETIQ